MPLAGGKTLPPAPNATLPGTVYSVPTGTPTANRRSFDGAAPGSVSSFTAASNNPSWGSSVGAFMVNGTLYTAFSNGQLMKQSFNGTSYGTATAVNAADAIVPQTDWHNTGKTYSAFGQITYNITPELILTGGGRYSHDTRYADLLSVYVVSTPALAARYKPVGTHIVGSNSSNNFSPEATLTYKPSSDLTLYAAYKTGYLAAGFSNNGAIASTQTVAREPDSQSTYRSSGPRRSPAMCALLASP